MNHKLRESRIERRRRIVVIIRETNEIHFGLPPSLVKKENRTQLDLLRRKARQIKSNPARRALLRSPNL